MSYSKSTRHYNLPQFQPLDSPTWYGDVNEAMHTIDETMYQNSFNSGGKALADEVTAIRGMIGENSDYLIDGSIHLNSKKMVLPGTVDYLNGKTNNIKTIIGNPNQLPHNPDGTVSPITNIINTMSGDIKNLTDLVADDSEAVGMVNNELSNVKKSVTKNTQDIAGIQGNIGNIEATADSANHNATTARINADEAISRVEVVENDLQGTNNALAPVINKVNDLMAFLNTFSKSYVEFNPVFSDWNPTMRLQQGYEGYLHSNYKGSEHIYEVILFANMVINASFIPNQCELVLDLYPTTTRYVYLNLNNIQELIIGTIYNLNSMKEIGKIFMNSVSISANKLYCTCIFSDFSSTNQDNIKLSLDITI